MFSNVKIYLPKPLRPFLIFLFLCPFLFPRFPDPTKVTVTASRKIINITGEEAEQLALQDARQKAIKEVVGIRVTENTTRLIEETVTGDNADQFKDVYSKFSQNTVYGKIIREEPPVIKKALENDIFTVSVELTAYVIEETGTRDPGFSVQISPSKSFYWVGLKGERDTLNFEIRATRDCYLYLFNIMSDNNVCLLLPNEQMPNNFFKYGEAKQQWQIDKASRKVHYRVGLPPNTPAVTEGLFVVALKDKLEFTSEHYLNDGQQTIPTYRAALEEIMQWLIQIPVDRRCDYYTPIFIRKRTN